MAYQFFNIGKANARIEELEKELAAAKTSPEGAAQQISDLDATNKQVSEQAEKLAADLKAANASIESLKAEHAKAVETIKADHAKAMKDLETSLKDNAAKVAQTITASIAAPAAPVVPASAAAPKEALTGFARITAAAANDLKAAGWQPKSK